MRRYPRESHDSRPKLALKGPREMLENFGILQSLEENYPSIKTIVISLYRDGSGRRTRQLIGGKAVPHAGTLMIYLYYDYYGHYSTYCTVMAN
jgi:hypothetical protein